MSRIFKLPIAWGFVPGPGFVESVGGAVAAIDVWLKHTADQQAVGAERLMMVDLQDRLAAIPQEANEAQLEAVAAAINSLVAFARRRGVVRLSNNTKR